MTPQPSRGDTYRKLAADFRARAAAETELSIKKEFGALSRGYTRLAEQADRNARPNDLVNETPERLRPGQVTAWRD